MAPRGTTKKSSKIKRKYYESDAYVNGIGERKESGKFIAYSMNDKGVIRGNKLSAKTLYTALKEKKKERLYYVFDKRSHAVATKEVHRAVHNPLMTKLSEDDGSFMEYVLSCRMAGRVDIKHLLAVAGMSESGKEFIRKVKIETGETKSFHKEITGKSLLEIVRSLRNVMIEHGEEFGGEKLCIALPQMVKGTTELRNPSAKGGIKAINHSLVSADSKYCRIADRVENLSALIPRDSEWSDRDIRILGECLVAKTKTFDDLNDDHTRARETLKSRKQSKSSTAQSIASAKEKVANARNEIERARAQISYLIDFQP